ncbi:DUF2520 domain-containing protein [Chitinibacter bivalviorum]|uniref:DUF2520 domain-containing protein n=1 Tax=Chitinibacter bivalviorum TaxID=2739434 RepID=A0A7H9BEJ1_9NEIS|nr:Rossmann-like and DUF2520 domain-containing protein [Chitinibacter bivalviorum]QLG87150.1 DUF2520 domain-containing protein [Chitinibacter bivalviorum]
MPSLNLIGAGRLGNSLAYLAHASGQYQIAGIYSRSEASSIAAREFIGAGNVFENLAQLPPADLWLLAVPDGAIATVASQLAQAGVVNAGAIVFHASGALAADQLAALSPLGAQCASLHPAFSFADPARAVATFAGTLCALEGDAAACEALARLVHAIGGVPFQLQGGKDAKVAYHAALSMAANYLVTLSDLALQTANQAGIAPEIANQLVLGLIRQTLVNVEQLGPAAALTGPIVRGDAATVAQHLAVLPSTHQASYRALGEATVVLAGDRLSDAARSALLNTLQSEPRST